MKIIIFGIGGRMGTAIYELATKEGIEVAAGIDAFADKLTLPVPVYKSLKECKEKGMVRVKQPTNWAKVCISFVQCALMVGLPVVNTFFVVVWLCNTNKCMETWEELTWECYCYPDELP